jgi:hypothetical protein
MRIVSLPALDQFFKVSIGIKPIKVVSYQIVTENILML